MFMQQTLCPGHVVLCSNIRRPNSLGFYGADDSEGIYVFKRVLQDVMVCDCIVLGPFHTQD